MSEQRISDERLAIACHKDERSIAPTWSNALIDVYELALDLRDCRAALADLEPQYVMAHNKIKRLAFSLAQAERERDETELDISWLINNDIHNKAQPADQLAMIRERLLTIRSRRYKP